MRRIPAVLIALAVVAFLVYSSIFMVNEREQALVLRFGEITREIREPGIYFKVPTGFIDTVQIIEDRLLSFDIEDMRVQVRDGRRYLVDAFVAFRIVDPREFRENVSGSLDIARENMRTRLDAALRRVYGQRSFEAALSEQRGEMMVEVRQQLTPLTAELGLEIVDVRIRRTDLLPEVSQQTFERMRAERLAEAARAARARHRACGAHPRRGGSRGGGDGRRRPARSRRFSAARAKPSAAVFSRRRISAIRISSSSTARCAPTSRRCWGRKRRWCCRRIRSSSASSRMPMEMAEALPPLRTLPEGPALTGSTEGEGESPPAAAAPEPSPGRRSGQRSGRGDALCSGAGRHAMSGG